jgi:putative ABC transport system substrate-binding protein
MKRRAFITLLGGAAAWPLVARARQTGKLPIVGFLVAGTPASHGQWVATFVQRLRELGWIEGRTVAIEHRWAEGHNERYTEIAAEFVRLKVDVIVTTAPAVPAAKQLTSVVPIVFALSGDPVGAGLVASLARPGIRQMAFSRPGTAWSDLMASFQEIRDEWSAIEGVVKLELLLEAEGLLIEEKRTMARPRFDLVRSRAV